MNEGDQITVNDGTGAAHGVYGFTPRNGAPPAQVIIAPGVYTFSALASVEVEGVLVEGFKAGRNTIIPLDRIEAVNGNPYP